MATWQPLELVPLRDVVAFQDAQIADENRTLGDLLKEVPAFSIGTPLDETTLAQPVKRLRIKIFPLAHISPTQALYPPPWGSGSAVTITPIAPSQETTASPLPNGPAQAEEPPFHVADAHPQSLDKATAVAIAYRLEVRKLATFLRSKLSVLVSCEKLIMPYLQRDILKNVWVPDTEGATVKESRLEPVVLEMPDSNETPLGGMNGPSRIGALRDLIANLKPHQVLVIPNLDLIGSGGEKTLGREARELTELIYSALDRLVLAFVDPSLPVPEVLAARFAIRAEVEGLRRDVPVDDTAIRDHVTAKSVLVGRVLITEHEAKFFAGFDPVELYKHIAGLNPIRLREAIAYATQVAHDHGYSKDRPAPVSLLYQEVRAFKAQTSGDFVVPNVKLSDIGGYEEVKRVIARALQLMGGEGHLPDERLRHELTPRGFLFHGPPGTGKTLFAKAIANQMNATIRIVSGPEVTDMYVGESERKVRAIFADARRSAPAVIVFDEFDSIAARRTGRDDGGSRAGNALVAQILTEMDGFRPEVPMLVIGTTNRLELIDEALLRPSRFEPIAISLPDVSARRRIAEIHARHFQIAISDDVLNAVANATRGFNGDEIRSLFRDACVGLYYEQIAADPWRLGYLIGRIRTRLDIQKIHATESRPAPRRGEGRRRPNAGMVQLTPTPSPTTTPPSTDAAAVAPQDEEVKS